MDSMSISYPIEILRRLLEFDESSDGACNAVAFTVSELKRLGYKPKRTGGGVYCDVGGRGKRSAFYAEYSCRCGVCVAELLGVLRSLGGRSENPLRFIFQFEEGSDGAQAMTDDGVLNGVDEIYALALCSELPAGKIGYCYGAMCAGVCEFDAVYRIGAMCRERDGKPDASSAVKQLVDAAARIAERNGVMFDAGDVTRVEDATNSECKSELRLRFYDMTKCEATLMDIERAALEIDDMSGLEHALIMHTVYPPLINDALAVDKIRAAAGEAATEVAPARSGNVFSCYLQKARGCMAWLGAGADGDTFPSDERILSYGAALFMRLID